MAGPDDAAPGPEDARRGGGDTYSSAAPGRPNRAAPASAPGTGPAALFSSTLGEFGGDVLVAREGFARIRYVVEPRLCNPRGTLQGGVFAVYVDEAMGYAVLSLLGPGARFATTDLVIHYLRPVWPGQEGATTVIAEGRVIRLGRSTAYLEGEVRDAGGEICARASSTVVVLT